MESNGTPECTSLTYGLTMRRITEVTYHTHATVQDAYVKTKRYIDIYKQEIDKKLNSMDAKLIAIDVKLVAIQAQLAALTTGTIAMSPIDIEKTGKLSRGVASSQVDSKADLI